MNIFLVDTFAKNAIRCGYMHTVADASEFEEYTGEEVRLALMNKGHKDSDFFYRAVGRIGCREVLLIFNDRDYEIMPGPSFGVTDGYFRFYCEDDLPTDYRVIPEDF